ncbi:hypothetical protein PENTCL1PPCAC_25560, partial [Pristionchus entomophagus]
HHHHHHQRRMLLQLALIMTALLACGSLIGVLFEIAWWAAWLLLPLLIWIAAATGDKAEELEPSQRRLLLNDLTMIMLISGMGSLVCSTFYAPAMKTLSMIMTSLAVPHFGLMKKDSDELHHNLLIPFFLPLMVISVGATGLPSPDSLLAAAPCILMTIYSTWLTEQGMRRNLSMKHRRVLCIFLFVAVRSLVFCSFLSYFHAPFYFAMLVTASLTATLFLLLSDYDIDKLHYAYMMTSCMVHMFAAAVIGGAVIMQMSDGQTKPTLLISRALSRSETEREHAKRGES